MSIGRARGVHLLRVSSGASVEPLGARQGVVWGRGSVGVGEGDSRSGGVHAVVEGVNSLSMMCWNVAGWSEGSVGAMRLV